MTHGTEVIEKLSTTLAQAGYEILEGEIGVAIVRKTDAPPIRPPLTDAELDEIHQRMNETDR